MKKGMTRANNIAGIFCHLHNLLPLGEDANRGGRPWAVPLPPIPGKTMQSFEVHPITITYNYVSINHLYCI